MKSYDFDRIFDKHQHVVLQFSAGKDSAACLWLLKPYWDRLTVLWANPGNPYPETVEYMDAIWDLVPRFVEVTGNQPEYVRQHGYPVDVLLINSTSFGVLAGKDAPIRMQPYSGCCSANMWFPMAEWCYQNGVTAIIRGQRLGDELKSPVRDGMNLLGIDYFMPIEDWTDAEVVEFLGDRIPDSYKRGIKTSLDCINCTAYAAHNQERIRDLQYIDRTVYAEVASVHQCLHRELTSYIPLVEVN